MWALIIYTGLGGLIGFVFVAYRGKKQAAYYGALIARHWDLLEQQYNAFIDKQLSQHPQVAPPFLSDAATRHIRPYTQQLMALLSTCPYVHIPIPFQGAFFGPLVAQSHNLLASAHRQQEPHITTVQLEQFEQQLKALMKEDIRARKEHHDF